MTSLDTTTTAGAGFASSDKASDTTSDTTSDNGSNLSDAGIKAIYARAYEIGKEEGAGAKARYEILNLVRVGALEGEIIVEPIKSGRKVKGTIDDTHIAKIAQRNTDGIVKKGGAASKATQKSRLQGVGMWCANHQATREQHSVWERTVDMHSAFEARNKNAAKGDTVPIYALAEVMIRVATMYTKVSKKDGIDNSQRTTPLTDQEIETCILRQRHSKEFSAVHKLYMAKLLAEIEARGGDDAEEEYKAMIGAGNSLTSLMAAE